MAIPQLPVTTDKPQLRLTLLLAIVLLGGLLLAGIYLNIVAQKVAEQQTRAQGELLGQQTVTLIKPALLAADPVSLNFILNQVAKQPQVDAIVLTDTRERQLGRAGDTPQNSTLSYEVTIKQQNQTLAYLVLHLNPDHYRQQISGLLIQSTLLALIIIIAALLVLWFNVNRSPPAEAQPHSEPDPEPLPPTTPETESSTETEPTSGGKQPIPDLKKAIHKQDPESLIELLRPAEDAPKMPGFAPFTEKEPSRNETLQQAPEQHPIVEEITLEPNLQNPARKKTTNPLFENAKHEIQLDLYSFEQELELIVAADQAGYLLYLDLASGHSDNITQDELHELQEFYYRMLDMVIAIYQGEAAKINNGDLQLAFVKPHKDDSHGVNAICASQLFNRLYKLFNKQRIRRMQPVLNLHMALVRGHYKKIPRLQEEARYLTHSTESNDLITHTALSEAPDLKVSLLAGADLIRSEEDKVLIRSVNDNYQKLLDKQANHLLKKLFP